MTPLRFACVTIVLATLLVACSEASAPAPPSPPVETPTAARPAIVVTRGATSEREVALTITVGDGASVERMLATLREANVRATFAVTGVWAEANVGLLLAIAADGHTLINNTYDGRSFTGASTGTPPLSAELRRLALSRVETTVYRLSSRSTRPYFRPPYGDVDDSVLRAAAAASFPVVVLWTFEASESDAATPAEIADRTLRLAEPGAIIELRASTGSPDAEALPLMIAGLRSQAYDFVTIGEFVPE